INAEFRRITTLPLQSKFLSQLDRFSDDLLKVFLKKGGVIRKRIQDAMVPMSQNDNIETKRECILKGLCIYLNEDPQHLVKEYL
ncbi:sterile alpha motif domain-containing protein 3-like isoform X1, partial [Clarias magur]